MSIYNAIANHGKDVGAGLNAFAQGRYRVAQDQRANALEDENRAYTKSRNVLADQRYSQEQKAALEAKADQHFKETLNLMAQAQDPAAVFQDRQRQAISMNLPGAREATLEQAMGYMPKPVDPDAEFKEFERKERLKANIRASTPLSPLEEAQLRSANANADSAQQRARDAQAQSEAAASTKSEVSELAQTILNNGRYQSVYGAAQGLLPTLRPDVIDAEADVDRLIDLLTLENTSKMTGVLSESDIKILQRAGTKLANKRISNAAAEAELRRIAGIFSKAAASGTLVRDKSGRVVGNEASEDGWGIVQ